ALYHALMESIHEDENAMDKGVIDKSKKRKPYDDDKDEGPPAGSDQWLKRKKTCKETESLKKAKSTGTSKGTTKSLPKSTSKSAQVEETMFEAKDIQGPQNLREDMGNTDETPVVNVDPNDWFKKPKRPPTSNPESYVELEYNMEECYKALTDQLDWNNPEGAKYPFDLSKPLPLIQSRNRQIVLVDYFFNNYLAYWQGGSTDKTYTTSLTKTKAAKYDLQGIEDMKKLNISRPLTHKAGITDLQPYTTYSNPQGVIYLDKLERNRLTCSHELYKFSDGTLISVRDKLKDMLNNLEMGYTSVIPRKRWSNLDKKWSRIMVKDIDR
ncbi:hypothetical protein Tco_1342179, partial [Tanacetum coccineum]